MSILVRVQTAVKWAVGDYLHRRGVFNGNGINYYTAPEWSSLFVPPVKQFINPDQRFKKPQHCPVTKDGSLWIAKQ